MKKLANMKTWKKLSLLAICILVCFGCIIGGWFAFIYLPYTGYSEGFERVITDFDELQYEKKSGDFDLEVHPPEFLKTGGFLVIRSGTFSVQVMNDGSLKYPSEPDISLFIWPSVFEKTKYGLMIDYSKADATAQSYIEFQKNELGEYEITHNFEDEVIIGIYDEYEQTIMGMINTLETHWEFNGVKDIITGWKANGSSIKYNN